LLELIYEVGFTQYGKDLIEMSKIAVNESIRNVGSELLLKKIYLEIRVRKWREIIFEGLTYIFALRG
jgi:hypothetical protein